MIKIIEEDKIIRVIPDRLIKTELEPLLSKRWIVRKREYHVPKSWASMELLLQCLPETEITPTHESESNRKIKPLAANESLEESTPTYFSDLNTTPWEHQARAINFALQRPSAMLAMHMGPLSGDTEYLSPDGWKRIDQYDGDQVAQYNLYSQNANFVQPTDYIKKPSEQMIHIKTRYGIDQMISEEHTMLIVDRKGNRRRMIARDFYNDHRRLKFGTKLKIPTTFLSNLGKGIALSCSEIRLMVAFIADGSIVKDSDGKGKISVLKDRKKKRLEYLLNQCNIDFKIHKDEPGFKCFYFKPPMLTKSYKEFWKCSPQQMRIIAEECIKWDGQIGKGTTDYFYSSDKESADFIQYCFSGLGYHASITTRNARKGKTEYVVNIRKNNRFKPLGVGGENSQDNVSVVPNEDGWKYCFSVPDGFLVLRRNNCVFISGNTGKSLCAIAIATSVQASRVLIICPKSVINVWPKQFRIHSKQEWNVLPLSAGSVKSRADLLKKQLRMTKTTSGKIAAVINYDSCWRGEMAKALKEADWDMLILDESQKIKGHRGNGAASRFVGLELYDIPRKLALSGYPMPHSPLDLFGQYRALDIGIFGNYFGKFESRYAIKGGYGQHQVVGYQNTKEFYDRFNMLAIQIKKEDAPELPPEIDEDLLIDIGSSAMKQYRKFEKDFYLEVESGEITAANAMVKLLRLQQLTSGFAKTDDDEIIEMDSSKASALADVLEDTQKPVVVFCRFTYDLSEVKRVAEKMGLCYGEVSGKRNDLTQDATLPGDVDVMGVQIQSGGVGVDLSNSCVAIYYSLGNSLGDYLQSRARLHRPGQKNKVTFIHFLARGTVDEKIYAALKKRKEVIDYILDKENY